MAGPCLCGDPYCPSCGSAMGFNPEFERVCEYLEELLDGMEVDVEELANRLGESEEVRTALEQASYSWAKGKRWKQARRRRRE